MQSSVLDDLPIQCLMKTTLILFLFGLSHLGIAAGDSLVKKIEGSHYGQKLKELEAVHGKADAKNENVIRWEKKNYTFVWDKKRELFYLEPKSLYLKSLPIERFEFERKALGDQNLGGLLSAPRKGLYLEADPDGKIKIVYWKRPWKMKEKKMISKREAIKLLHSPKAKK